MKSSTFGAGKLGNVDAPAHKATTIRGSHMRTESAGVKYGLSSVMAFESESATEPMANYDRDPMTGNATERISRNPKKGPMPSEKGNEFEFC